MLKFFRNTRKSLLVENKTSKYLKYAIGEIVLVVIGILIALQINNWNSNRLDRISEKQFLKEIRANLNEDLQKIEWVRQFNKAKDSAITIAFEILSSNSNSGLKKRKMTNLFPFLTEYNVFLSNKVAFDNMTSSFSINLISNDSLRQQLSEYYNNTSSLTDFTQEQVKQQTRKFIDESITMFLDTNTAKTLSGFEIEIIQNEDFFTHPLTFKNLFNMRMNMIGQNNMLTAMETKIHSLLNIL